jgi:hypothetical protein
VCMYLNDPRGDDQRDARHVVAQHALGRRPERQPAAAVLSRHHLTRAAVSDSG